MITKKKPYEFWNYRDTRKQKFPPLKPLTLFDMEVQPSNTITGFLSNNILIPIKGLHPTLLTKLQNDLTIRNPDFEKAQKFGKGFVPYSVPEFIKLYSIDNEYIGLPRSVKWDYLDRQFSKCGYKLQVEDIRPKFPKIKFQQKNVVKPLFYQKEAIDHIVEGNTVIQFACGKGKTFLSLLAVAEVGYRTLILVRTNIILQQWVDAIKEVLLIDDKDIGMINGDNKTEGLITVATEQSLVGMSRDEKRRIGESYGHVIFDECHETAAAQYRDLLTFFKAKRVTGLSATPDREDGLTPIVKAYIGQIVQVDDLGEIPTYIDTINTDFTFSFQSIRKETQYNSLLEALARDRMRNISILGKVIAYAKKGHYIIVHSKRIEHLESLKDILSIIEPTIKSDILTSTAYGEDISINKQNEIKAKFLSGETQVLFGGTIVEQGFNVPRVSVVVLATPTKSRRLIKQLLGRAQREYEGKKCAYLVDFVDRNVPILLYQFFARNKKVYKAYEKKSLPSAPVDLQAALKAVVIRDKKLLEAIARVEDVYYEKLLVEEKSW